MPEQYERWHMSKNISVINLIGLVMSTVTILITVTWGASVLNSEIQQNKRDIAKGVYTTERYREESIVANDRIRANIVRVEQQTSAQAVAIGRIEVGIDNVQRTLEAVSEKLDK